MISGRAVLITGCNGGIGSALVREFKKHGYFVIGTDLSSTNTESVDIFFALDLIELCVEAELQAEISGKLRQILSDEGLQLGAIINNAATQIVKGFTQLETDDFQRSLCCNVMAPFVLVKLFQQQLIEAQGSVVNIGSVHSSLTKAGFCAYSTSKAGLSGLTRSLALELGGQVTVNIIQPAATDTDMLRAGFDGHKWGYDALASCHPAGRIAKPIEIASLAVFLCSPESRFVTGSEIPIDGGISCRLHDPA